MSMETTPDGNCEILLRKKIDEYHGERIYEHLCKPITQEKDFAI